MDERRFTVHALDAQHDIRVGALPDRLRLPESAFEALWTLKPARYHQIRMGGRWVDTPRWQQAFGADYRYTGHINRALPVPAILTPYLDYSRDAVDPRLNGMLVNWYDAALGHYIGRHRDKPNDLIAGAPIITLSFGAPRTFRLRPWKGTGKLDFDLIDGTVVILPFATNQAWTHEVPLFAKDVGRRVSVTIRAFASAQTTYRDQPPESGRIQAQEGAGSDPASGTRDGP